MLLFLCSCALAQGNCTTAVNINQLNKFCSGTASYQTTSSVALYWFKFTAIANDVEISVKSGTLISPELHLLSDCGGTELVGAANSTPTTTTLYKAGLVIGQEYYFTVNGNSPGTFQLCMDNRQSPVKAGQDCATALLLCNTQGFTQTDVSGGGLNSDEAKGTCLNSPGELSESNSVWYKWQAANNGTLVFTITPGKSTDDIDFVLYDMGLTGDCSMISAANAIRCAAGHGVSNTGCPGDPIYYKVGLDFHETEVSEASGCGSGQNGKLSALIMQTGHYYALMVNNFSNQNNSFKLDFTDQTGQAGTGELVGPRAKIVLTATDTCTVNQKYTFASQSTGELSRRWSFGSGASIPASTDSGPFTITYSSPGIKTVTLEITSDRGCTSLDYKNIFVSLPPVKPVVTINQTKFCVGDTVVLKSPAIPGLTYAWSGPGNFSAEGPFVSFKIQSPAQAGTYSLTAFDLHCSSEPALLSIPAVLDTPMAAFTSSLPFPSKVNAPTEVNFRNESVRANTYFWDFGDGTSSTQTSPSHIYRKPGRYQVKLIAFRDQVCRSSVAKGEYEVLNSNVIAVPPLITPNGDGINDRFVVSLASVTSYQIEIFNRWGSIVYTSKNIFEDWDGTYHGQPLPAGAYFYVIQAFDKDRQPIRKSGSVTLLR